MLEKEIDPYIEAVKARERRLPVVLSREEVEAVLSELEETHYLICALMYGGGLRVSEAVRLRVKDLDFERGLITVFSGKGDKDRVTVFPRELTPELEVHLAKIREIYHQDRRARVAGVYLPYALERKYPEAGKEWAWFWLFPSKDLSVDPRTETVRRHHIHPSAVQRAFKKALRKAGGKSKWSIPFGISYYWTLLGDCPPVCVNFVIAGPRRELLSGRISEASP